MTGELRNRVIMNLLVKFAADTIIGLSAEILATKTIEHHGGQQMKSNHASCNTSYLVG